MAPMKRVLADLADYLTRELDFSRGVFPVTGTGIVPGIEFTLQPGDVVSIQVGSVAIKNRVTT
jgi:2-dehydro-3-deoxy-D-arabinonate dehydratase